MATPAHPLRALLNELSPTLRRQALMHPVAADAPSESYERLEFLGDAILGAAVTAELFRQFPDLSEGELSRIKAAAVSRTPCARVAQTAELGEAMRAELSAHSDQTLIHDLTHLDRVLAALTESLIGAGFLQFGYEYVAPIVVASFADRIGHAVDNRTDAKSDLQELAQRSGHTVSYEMVSSRGPDHDREFTMLARIVGTDVDSGLVAMGSGRSKKAAQQDAAQHLLQQLEDMTEGSSKDASKAD